MKISLAPVRALCATTALLVLSTIAFSDYTARLYFRNETTGEDGPGAVSVIPGQQVSLNWSFHRSAGDTKSCWEILQVFIDLASTGANAILTDVDANTWNTAIQTRFAPDTVFPTLFQWQPDDGPIYDFGINPGNSSYPLITSRGAYLLVGCAGLFTQSHDIDAAFFDFVVGDTAAPGAELDWGLPGRDTDIGITTRIYDGNQDNVDPTDNHIVVADGPVSRVSGLVTLASGSGLGPPPPSVTGVLTRNGQLGHTIKLHLNADGTFTMPLLSDGYTLSCQRTHWLRRKVYVPAEGGDVTGIDFSLPNGDANADGKVNLLDLSTVLRSFGADKPIGYADLNEDGAVTIKDVMIVFSNYNKVADPP